MRFLVVFTHTALASSVWEALSQREVEPYDEPQLLADLWRLRVVERGSNQLRLEVARSGDGHGDFGITFCLALETARQWLLWAPALMIDNLIIG